MPTLADDIATVEAVMPGRPAPVGYAAAFFRLVDYEALLHVLDAARAKEAIEKNWLAERKETERLRAAAAALGRKGGKAGKGSAKRRGDSAYYRKLRLGKAIKKTQD